MSTPAEMLAAAIEDGDWDAVKAAQTLLSAPKPKTKAAPKKKAAPKLAPKPKAAPKTKQVSQAKSVPANNFVPEALVPNAFSPKAHKKIMPRSKPHPEASDRVREPAPQKTSVVCSVCNRTFMAHPDDLIEAASSDPGDGTRLIKCDGCLRK